VASQASYALPAGLVEVVRVEHPPGTYRTYQPRVGGDALDPVPLADQPRASAYSYDLWGYQLVLAPAPTQSGESIVVRHTAQCPEPAADTDPLPVEQADTDLLLLHTCARALLWIDAHEGKRQAYERDRGQTAAAQAAAYQQRYLAALQARQRTQRSAPRRLVLRD